MFDCSLAFVSKPWQSHHQQIALYTCCWCCTCISRYPDHYDLHDQDSCTWNLCSSSKRWQSLPVLWVICAIIPPWAPLVHALSNTSSSEGSRWHREAVWTVVLALGKSHLWWWNTSGSVSQQQSDKCSDCTRCQWDMERSWEEAGRSQWEGQQACVYSDEQHLCIWHCPSNTSDLC